MNEQQIRLIGIIALVIVGGLLITPAQKWYKSNNQLNQAINSAKYAHDEWVKYHNAETNEKDYSEKNMWGMKRAYWGGEENRLNKEALQYKSEVNNHGFGCIVYLIGIAILTPVVVKPKFVGTKLGVLKESKT